MLSPLQAPPSGDRAVTGLTSILVAQPQVPDYLDRPQIVERTTANELKLVEADQWAERLSINVSRVVAPEPVIDDSRRRQCCRRRARLAAL